MDRFELYNELQDVVSMLDGESFPELHICLANSMDEENGVTVDPYELANQILCLDRPCDFPQIVLDLIIELFEASFEAGNADAMNDLGAQYYSGNRGFAQDFGKAVHYYDLAAKNGSRQAQENLGYCYYYGRNMPVDYEKAFHYFALGALDGHLLSLYKIGDMYAAGYYAEKNEIETFHIYERCMETMTDEAATAVAGPVFLRLRKCFLNGIGAKRNPQTALICYQKAEVYLYDKVKSGDVMYRKSLQTAIDGQAKARAILAQDLPQNEWIYD